MKRSKDIVRCILGAALVFTFGCGGGGGLPDGETGTVAGQVTYNGQAVPEGSAVIFMKREGGIIATGVTDAAGNYALTMRDGADILVGTYNVGVSPPVADSGMTDEQIMEAGEAPEQAPSPFPERYLSAESSGLFFDVSTGGNTIDIELTDAE